MLVIRIGYRSSVTTLLTKSKVSVCLLICMVVFYVSEGPIMIKTKVKNLQLHTKQQ